MVKPALPYLDVIRRAKQETGFPRLADVPGARHPVRLALDPVATERRVVSVGRIDRDRAADLPAILSGRPSGLVAPGPFARLDRDHDLQPLRPVHRAGSGEPQ